MRVCRRMSSYLPYYDRFPRLPRLAYNRLFRDLLSVATYYSIVSIVVYSVFSADWYLYSICRLVYISRFRSYTGLQAAYI